MEKNLKTRIIHKHDIEANWMKATNFIPLQGEIVVYDIEKETDNLPEGRTNKYSYERLKIGDGISNVNDLPFAYVSRADYEALLARFEALEARVAILNSGFAANEEEMKSGSILEPAEEMSV